MKGGINTVVFMVVPDKPDEGKKTTEAKAGLAFHAAQSVTQFTQMQGGDLRSEMRQIGSVEGARFKGGVEAGSDVE